MAETDTQVTQASNRPAALSSSQAAVRHVAYAFDKGYVDVTLLSIASLARHQQPEHETVIHLITDGELPAAARDRFETIARRHDKLTLHWHPVTEQQASRFEAGWRWPRATYFRLLLPELLDGLTDRVIYIDGDTLVLSDLDGFWRWDLGDAVIGGCVDATWPNARLRKEQFARHNREIPEVWQAVEDDYPYMNGGVLLLNLAAWREQGITPTCYRMMQQHPESCEIVDQDLLTVIRVKRAVVDPKWNIQAGALGWYTYHKTTRTYESSMGRSFEALMQAPGILHFCGDCPWHGLSISRLASSNPVEKQYFAELKRSELMNRPTYALHVINLLGRGLVRDLKTMRHRLRKRYKEVGS